MQNTETNTGAGPAREYPLIDRLASELKNLLRAMEPPCEVTTHFRNARVEVLKGIRHMIDHRIEQLERTGQRGQKIAVE
jgi:hypothetical protein